MSDESAMRAALESTETKATVLHSILRHKYGEAFYEWDLATIALEVHDDFGATLSSEAADRIATIQLLMTTDAPFKRLDAFMAVCASLSTGEPYFDIFDPVTTEQMAWGIAEMSLNREMLPFGYAIQQYLKMQLLQDGYSRDFPGFFDAVLEADTKEEAQAIRAKVREADLNPNTDVVNGLLDEEMADLVYQFNQIPSLKGVDNVLLSDDTATLVSAMSP